MSQTIEVYEWIGERAHDDQRRYRDQLIDVLAVPPDGQLPNVSDVIVVHDHQAGTPLTGYKRYRVIEREFLWLSRGEEDPISTPQKWSRMWLHVRRVDEDR